MSGHSHYATIHRQKEVKDAQKGKVFSKLAREITIAVKSGGGITDLDANYKLRMVVEKARSANMPKANIDRAINSGISGEALEEIIYEGFGPKGIAVMVTVATDNRNRTAQEIKNLFEKNGGNLAGPGAVSFNFQNKGLLLLAKGANPEEQMLKLIDLGVEDINEGEGTIEVYVTPERLKETKEVLEKSGFSVQTADLVMRPKTWVTISENKEAEKVIAFLDALNDHDDVQKVFDNADIPITSG